MALYILSWPGLPEIPFYIIDPKSNKLYSSEKPVPTDKSDLDVFDNRYVKLSRIFELFAPNMVSELHFILETLQKRFNVKPIRRLTEKPRKTTSYLPVEMLLMLIVVWPLCASFQMTKKALLNYLDHFPETVCTDCGYVQRDCKCDRLRQNSNQRNAFVGFGTTATEKGVQTDAIAAPMALGQTFGTNSMPSVCSGMPTNSPGISVLIPSAVKLPPGMKIPLPPPGHPVPPLCYPTTSGPLAVNMLDMGNNPFGFLKPTGGGTGVIQQAPPLLLPQPRSHKRGRPPVAPIPYLYQTSVGYQPNVAFFGPFTTGDGNGGAMPTASSLMQIPGLQGILPADLPLQGCLPSTVACGMNYIRPSTSNGASAALQHLSSPALGELRAREPFQSFPSRKRKYSESELHLNGRGTMTKTVGIQTATKSFIKKCKLKEEKLADRIDGGASRGSAAVTIVNDAKEAGENGTGESDTTSDQARLSSRQSATDNLRNSPGKASLFSDFFRGGKEERDVGSSKKFGGKLWRQLEDSSDEDKPIDSILDNAKKPDMEIGDGELRGAKVLDESQLSQELDKNLPVGGSENGATPDKDVGSRSNDVPERGSATQETLAASHATKTKDKDDSKMEVDAAEVNHLDNPLPGTSRTSSQFCEKETSAEDSRLDMDMDGERSLVICESNEMDQPLSKPSVDSEGDVFKVLPDEITDDGRKVVENEASGNDQKDALHADKSRDAAVVEDSDATKGTNVGQGTESGNTLPSVPAVRKIYGKFEYVPTREHIFRCLIPKCSQSFDTRLAAELHNLVHPEGDSVNHLRCPNCEFTAPFYQWFDLVRHMRWSHQIFMSREPFSCKLCGLMFENEDSLSSHIDFHYSNRYKCIHCGLLLLTWGQVKRHLEGCVDKHKGNLNLGCPYCTFVFHKKNIRNLHLLSHSDVGLACALCQDNAAWADWKTLRKHYQNRHTKTLQGKIAPFRHKLPKKRKPPRCKRCDVEFKNMELYAAHMTRTHDLVPYTLVECAQCGHKFRTERSHEWHVKHVHVEEIPCEKCDFVATSKSVMKAHVVQKHSDKQHTCSECDKSFSYYHQLKVHMAHHARRTIYPCQQCDQEFSRQSDLRQHMVSDHSDPSDKAPQSCPECDYRCYSRANLNAHIKKTHPELLEDDNATAGAGGGAEEEEEGADHCYFTKKGDAQPVVEPPRVRRVGRRKGRQRKVIKYEWDRAKRLDGYSSVEDRRERRRLNRLMKEQDDRLKKLTKSTCARTRSYLEHQDMKNGGKMKIHGAIGRENQPLDRQLLPARGTRAAAGLDDVPEEFGGTEMAGIGIYSAQPYLDHSYFKLENSVPWGLERTKPRLSFVLSDCSGEAPVESTPDPSAFQECETQLLGLGPAPPVRKRGRPPNTSLNRPVLAARRKFTSVLESISSVGVMQSRNYQTLRITPRTLPTVSVAEATPAEDDGLENLSAEIPDFELITESDLLKNLGGYNIIDELLGMTQAPGGGFQSPDGSIKKIPPGELPNPNAVKFSFTQREAGEATSVLSNTFSDGLVIDSEGPLSADFDDIELGEDVYSLFLGSSHAAQGTAGVQVGNGDEAGKTGINIPSSVSQNDILSLTSFPTSVPYLMNSPLHRGLVSPRRMANSLALRTGLQTAAARGSTAAVSSNVATNLGVLQSISVNQSTGNSTLLNISALTAPNSVASSSHNDHLADPDRDVMPGNSELPASTDVDRSVEHTDNIPCWNDLLKLSEVASNLCLPSGSNVTDGVLASRSHRSRSPSAALDGSKSQQVSEVSEGEASSPRTNAVPDGTIKTTTTGVGCALGAKEPHGVLAHPSNDLANVTAETQEYVSIVKETHGFPLQPSASLGTDCTSQESKEVTQTADEERDCQSEIACRHSIPNDRSTTTEGTVLVSSSTTVDQQ